MSFPLCSRAVRHWGYCSLVGLVCGVNSLLPWHVVSRSIYMYVLSDPPYAKHPRKEKMLSKV